jgi:hypothetical protein
MHGFLAIMLACSIHSCSTDVPCFDYVIDEALQRRVGGRIRNTAADDEHAYQTLVDSLLGFGNEAVPYLIRELDSTNRFDKNLLIASVISDLEDSSGFTCLIKLFDLTKDKVQKQMCALVFAVLETKRKDLVGTRVPPVELLRVLIETVVDTSKLGADSNPDNPGSYADLALMKIGSWTGFSDPELIEIISVPGRIDSHDEGMQTRAALDRWWKQNRNRIVWNHQNRFFEVGK